MKPGMKGLNQLEVATLMEELNTINGMLSHGTAEEKARAKKLLAEHYEPIVLQHLNMDAIKLAQIEMGFNDDDLGIRSTELIC